jgi:hypothetical protein
VKNGIFLNGETNKNDIGEEGEMQPSINNIQFRHNDYLGDPESIEGSFDYY